MTHCFLNTKKTNLLSGMISLALLFPATSFAMENRSVSELIQDAQWMKTFQQEIQMAQSNPKTKSCGYLAIEKGGIADGLSLRSKGDLEQLSQFLTNKREQVTIFQKRNYDPLISYVKELISKKGPNEWTQVDGEILGVETRKGELIAANKPKVRLEDVLVGRFAESKKEKPFDQVDQNLLSGVKSSQEKDFWGVEKGKVKEIASWWPGMTPEQKETVQQAQNLIRLLRMGYENPKLKQTHPKLDMAHAARDLAKNLDVLKFLGAESTRVQQELESSIKKIENLQNERKSLEFLLQINGQETIKYRRISYRNSDEFFWGYEIKRDKKDKDGKIVKEVEFFKASKSIEQFIEEGHIEQQNAEMLKRKLDKEKEVIIEKIGGVEYQITHLINLLG